MRVILDDRGRRVEGRDTALLVREARRLTGRRVGDPRLVMWLPAVLFPVYAILMIPGVILAKDYVLGAICLVMFALPVAGLLARYSRRSLPAPRAETLAPTVLQFRRCGGCGYGLETMAPESDGCVVCPECGAAWHRDRFVVGNSGEALGGLAGADAQSAGPDEPGSSMVRLAPPTSRALRNVDDRLVPLRSLRDRAATPVHLNPAARQALAARVYRRVRWVAAVALAGGLLVVSTAILAGFPRWKDDLDFLPWMLGLGTVVLALFVLLSSDWPGRRRSLLAVGVCPCCHEMLRPARTEFDGCFRCARCTAAWRAADTTIQA